MTSFPLLLVLLLGTADVPVDSSRGKGGKAGLHADETIEVDGTEREYRLLVPRGAGIRKAAPLVFAFHGRGGNKDRLASYCGLDTTARKEKFILVYLSAQAGNWKLRSPRDNTDLAFFDAVYDLLCSRYEIDRNRVYCTGMSMGGYFSNFVAAHRSDVIAAIAPHSGGLGALAFTGIKARSRYAVLVVHGDEDRIVPVSEGHRSKEAYEKAGHPVEYLEIQGLGHRWATAQSINQKIWKFFEEHPRGAQPRAENKAATLISTSTPRSGEQYHVSMRGDDANVGTAARPLRTISAAALRARPGDVITAHEGVYRERIDPSRGGTSDARRIVYQAAPGEKVVIRGSEVIKGWQKAQNDTWKVTIPDAFFGDFNPFKDPIQGDWFNPRGRAHHTGAVYLDGHWLTEAATLREVLEPAGDDPLWFTPSSGPGPAAGYLLNVAWLRPDETNAAARIPANALAAQHGIQTASCSEGGQCIGWIEAGDWARYEDVDFGPGSEQVEIRAASPTGGGVIELRLDQPDGQLLGTCTVEDTGDWQKWASFTAKIEPTRGRKTLCLVFRPHDVEDPPEVDEDVTAIWAQFRGVDPNEAEVEINVRQAVFYPDEPGVNFITVRGFTLEHAATNWAPPTAEQVGLIGTHWSRGWIIENNTIRYSVCTGVTLGKHGDEFDNTSADTAEGYVETIERATARGWSKESIGHHVVRDNRISHCEQAGIVGSMGPVFCTVTGNTIHDIHVRRLFTGAEMAGIKFHGAIDTVISNNHIHRTCLGIWLDWMTQGTRVTRNLLHDNGRDFFAEVNHGPFLVDNNVFLSRNGLLINSQGGAYAHNLVAGTVSVAHEEGRHTPYHEAHSTKVAGLAPNPSGDDRYYNNVFLRAGLPAYDPAKLPVFMAGNVFLQGARPSKHESSPLVKPEIDPGLELVEKPDGLYLNVTLDEAWARGQQRSLVTTELLGKAKIPDLPYEQADGSPYRIETDYLGRARDPANPFPGPLELRQGGSQLLKVWPVGPLR